jgi:CheY-like chemotaxis protein
LGLSISRHFVQLLGGTIQVRSKLGQGSRFRVEVPAQIAEASEVVTETSEAKHVVGLEPGQPEYRILIVEDERENWVLLQRLLQTVGFDVRVAEDGAEAVECFESWRPHFIWMDIRLPVMSGLEAARRIRELEEERNTKIVAVTASAFASEREEVLAAGFDDFLRKPYRHDEIFNCMARNLGIRFVYSTPAGALAEVSSGTLRSEDLEALSAELREELERSVLSLDSKRIEQVVDQVAIENEALGSILRRFTARLVYSPILHAVQRCNRGLARARS